jgi:hypothetical protein
MPKYFKAGTNIVGLPKKMVFIDKSGGAHLYPSLTPKNHLATHYGTSAIETAYNTKPGNLLKVTKGQYENYKDKVKKQKKAAKKLVKASADVAVAEKKMRGRPRKNPAAPVVAVVGAAPKVRRPRTEEQKKESAAKRAMTIANKKMALLNTGSNKTDLVTKLNASVIANDMFNELLPAALATLPKAKRGRPKGSGKKKAQ